MIDIQKLYNNSKLEPKYEQLPNNTNQVYTKFLNDKVQITEKALKAQLLKDLYYINYELNTITELTEELSEIGLKQLPTGERIKKFSTILKNEKEQSEEIIMSNQSQEQVCISKMPENLNPKFLSFKRHC